MTTTSRAIDLTHPEVLSDTARYILGRLDPPRKKSQIPVKPIVVEFMGLHKAGKDSNLVELDRWFKRRGFQVLIRQESAETRDIRTMSRTNPYVYEMRHFSYTFSNFLEALTSRDFHLIVLNRGFVDTLCWLEMHRRQGSVSDEQFEQFRAYILNGPWLEGLDAVVCLMCSVETSLKREYGTTKNVIYGSRMNPKSLALMRDCVESVFEYISDRYPNLPLIKVNTDDRPISETRDEIVGSVLGAVKERMHVVDEELIAHSPALLRELAEDAGRQEIKFMGSVHIQALLRHGWHPQGVTSEIDTYLTPKSQPALVDDECFHLRFYGKHGEQRHCYLVYKRRGGASSRDRVSVPVLWDTVPGFFDIFDKVAVIEKEREIFVRGDMILVVDQVEGLGSFVEIRAPLSSDVMAEAAKLGLTPDRMVPETYLRLFLKNQAKAESR